MKLATIELWRFRVPFKQSFAHAAHTRAESDAIIIGVTTEAGTQGFGEIQARPYVTGESNDAIWADGARPFAEKLLGSSVERFDDIADLLGGRPAYDEAPACVGGFDIALADAFELEHGLDWNAVFGPERKSKTTKCLTIGQDVNGSELVRQGRYARLSGCGVVKLKVKQPADAERCLALRAAMGDAPALRLDANGELSLDEAVELLTASADARVESIEEPLADEPGLVARLEALFEATGVSQVADESICRPRDLDRFASPGAYQQVNVRVGKCGGVSGTADVLRYAIEKGFGVVSGTMVGETPVMLRVSQALLAHCEALSYVEGLDQAEVLSEARVIEHIDDKIGDNTAAHFAWNADAVRKYLVDHQIANQRRV